MPRSLRGRLIAILLLLVTAAVASGLTMLGLFQQSASAQIGQAEAETTSACGAIGAAYRFATTDRAGGPLGLGTAALERNLVGVVVSALKDRQGIEGGVWQREAGPLAYAYPTYEGSGPKTDLPAAERPLIQAVNRAASLDDRLEVSRTRSASQTLLVSACPLPGPIASLTAWTMTRAHRFDSRSYLQLMAGLTILFATILAASILAATLILTWSRHVERIERALGERDMGELPVIATTGERELDRIVMALNDAGRRLEASRRLASELSQQVATSRRLAALGRIAAGLAHEIRNPIAAMRLKAETALRGGSDRKDRALSAVLGQVDRLEHLLQRLLNMTSHDPPDYAAVALAPFLAACADMHAELAGTRGVIIVPRAEVEAGWFDRDQIHRALDNLLLNALGVAPAGSTVDLTARRQGEALLLGVADHGPGPPAAIRDQLFEPFVSGRPEGTGLGLSIVREIAEAHGGAARFGIVDRTTLFEIEIPWRPF